MSINITECVTAIAAELNRLHPDGELDANQLDPKALPVFRTARTGRTVNFSEFASRHVSHLAEHIYENSQDLHPIILRDSFIEVVAQAVADCFAENSMPPQVSPVDAFRAIRSDAIEAAKKMQADLTHYFPAWTFSIEERNEFSIGPVRFLPVTRWIDEIDFHPEALAAFKSSIDDLKKSIRSLIAGGADRSSASNLPRWVYDAIGKHRSILAITMTGSELQLSRQRARFLAKGALDSLALVFSDPKLHRSVLLHDEPSPPITVSSLTASRGYLWLPGVSSNIKGWLGNEKYLDEAIRDSSKFLEAVGIALQAVREPSSNRHPLLAKRWCVALAWAGDAAREKNDQVALTKYATSLDILSCGGKTSGITQLISNLLGWPADQKITHNNKTLKNVVDAVYAHGRSRILHGTHADPMLDFARERDWGGSLARMTLRAAIIALSEYNGDDSDQGFQHLSTPSDKGAPRS